MSLDAISRPLITGSSTDRMIEARRDRDQEERKRTQPREDAAEVIADRREDGVGGSPARAF